jgi:hypothetical protein
VLHVPLALQVLVPVHAHGAVDVGEHSTLAPAEHTGVEPLHVPQDTRLPQWFTALPQVFPAQVCRSSMQAQGLPTHVFGVANGGTACHALAAAFQHIFTTFASLRLIIDFGQSPSGARPAQVVAGCRETEPEDRARSDQPHVHRRDRERRASKRDFRALGRPLVGDEQQLVEPRLEQLDPGARSRS